MIWLSNKSVFEQPSRTNCVRKPRFDCNCIAIHTLQSIFVPAPLEAVLMPLSVFLHCVPLKNPFLVKACYMLKRIENSCCYCRMASPPLLMQAFQLFTIVMQCNCGLAKKIVKTTTNAQKNIDHLFKQHCVHHNKGQLMVQAMHIRNLAVFSFL